jgi:hypothetical protein
MTIRTALAVFSLVFGVAVLGAIFTTRRVFAWQRKGAMARTPYVI